MIIDCHVHLNNYTTGQRAPQESVDLLVADMRKYGIDQAFVLTSYLANEARPRVEQVLDLLAPHPQLHVVEGISLSGGAPLDLRATEERLRSGRTIGLKLYPGYEHYYPTDRLCVPIYDIAAKHGVPVMFHTGDTYTKLGKLKYSHPLHLDDVAVDHPDLKIVICHLGNPWFRDTAELVYKNDNIRADISGLVLGEFEAKFEQWVAAQVRELIVYAGDPEDLMFGTDWPLAGMGTYTKFVRSLDLEEEHVEMLMGGNARDWFNLDKVNERKAARQGGQ